MSSTSHSWKARHVQWLLPKGLMGKRRKNRPALQWRELLNIPSAGRPRSTSPVKSHVGWWDENGTPPRWISPQIHHFSQITRKTSDKCQLEFILQNSVKLPRLPKTRQVWETVTAKGSLGRPGQANVMWSPGQDPGQEKGLGKNSGNLKSGWTLINGNISSLIMINLLYSCKMLVTEETGSEICGNSVLSSLFFYKSKTILKLKFS